MQTFPLWYHPFLFQDHSSKFQVKLCICFYWFILSGEENQPKRSIDLPAGQNVQFPSLLQLNGMICSIFSRNDIISIACYLHRKNISLFATTQTSQAPGNLTGGSGSYQICSSDVEWPAVCAICMPPSTYGLLLHSAREELLQNTGPYILLHVRQEICSWKMSYWKTEGFIGWWEKA